MTLLHFAKYLTPGSLVPEEVTKQLTRRSVEEAVARAPESAFCFTLFDRRAEAPDLGPEFVVTPKALNRSPGRYYLGGQKFDLDGLRRWIDSHGGPEAHYPLWSNIKNNGHTGAILCRTGNWQPFDEHDVWIEL